MLLGNLDATYQVIYTSNPWRRSRVLSPLRSKCLLRCSMIFFSSTRCRDISLYEAAQIIEYSKNGVSWWRSRAVRPAGTVTYGLNFARSTRYISTSLSASLSLNNDSRGSNWLWIPLPSRVEVGCTSPEGPIDFLILTGRTSGLDAMGPLVETVVLRSDIKPSSFFSILAAWL